MGLMRVELTVQDRVWAEFCRVVAEQHRDCCKRTPASVLYEMMRHIVLEDRAQKMLEEKTKKAGIKMPGRDEMTMGEIIDQLINPDPRVANPTPEEDADWNEMIALMAEGAERL